VIVILEQIYLGCLAQASYLIADEESKRACVVDPRRDVDHYLQVANERGLTIEHVILTHFHADFVAGHLELQAKTGASIHLGAKAQAEYEFEAAADGGTIELGPQVRLSFLETPGHTPEGISILVYDLSASGEQPHAVLTGDTLFIGDVGRPDLLASVGVTKEELAGQLYDSLHQKLLPLPDETIVYPGHGAGSACGKNMSQETFSTLGQQRRFNYALQPMGKDAFVAMISEGQPTAPAYFGYDAQLNKQKRATLDEALQTALQPLSLERVLELAAAGAQLLDSRHPDAFAPRHLKGSINVGLGGRYATWCGTVLDVAQPIVIVAEPGTEEESAVRLGRIGFDNVAGYLEGGVDALADRDDLVEGWPRVTPGQLRELLASDGPPALLDVRPCGAFDEGHIEGALNVPLAQLSARLDEVPAGEVALNCRSGYTSSIAASLLARAGRTPKADLIGGFNAWEGEGAACDTQGTCSS
jgi:glyoxylase-like metal-dependent hydrolase (beta-lactamase superfamily II)/rhodanese-related sulfurtransferase